MLSTLQRALSVPGGDYQARFQSGNGIATKQGLANYSSQATSIALPVFVQPRKLTAAVMNNTISRCEEIHEIQMSVFTVKLWEHSHAHLPMTAALNFSSSRLEQLGQGPYGLQGLRYFLCGPFQKSANCWPFDLEVWVGLGLLVSGTRPFWQDP